MLVQVVLGYICLLSHLCSSRILETLLLFLLSTKLIGIKIEGVMCRDNIEHTLYDVEATAFTCLSGVCLAFLSPAAAFLPLADVFSSPPFSSLSLK